MSIRTLPRKQRGLIAATAISLFAALTLLAPLPALAQTENSYSAVTIEYPSDAETTIAAERDFYVIGTGYDVANRGVKIELFAGSNTEAQPARSLVYDTAHARTFTLAKEGALPAISNLFNDKDNPLAIADLLMPDLSYNPTVAGSAANPSSKITANSRNYAALIFGGASNHLGIVAESALAGSYTLRVTLGINTPDTLLDDETTTKSLTFASTENKVASRFSPDNHLSNVKSDAATKGFRTYIDPFPGYWSPQNMGCIAYNGQLYTKRDIFIESYLRWRFADSLEYETGNVQLYLYNISPTSTTQSVEVAAVQRTNRIESELYPWYYDIGEPTISTNDGTLTGTLIALPQGDKLALTRAHVGADAGAENHYATYLTIPDAVDTNYSDGVEAAEGEQLALFGVTAPLQNSSSDIVHEGDGFYTTKNDVDSIVYTFLKDGTPVYEETKSVDLFRDFAADWKDAESTYEFKHVFALDNALAAGTYEVQASALDTYGNPVAGGAETFTLTVKAPTPAAPVDPPAPTPPASDTAKPLTPTPLVATGDNTPLLLVVLVLTLVTSATTVALARKQSH